MKISDDEKKFWRACYWYLASWKFSWTGLALGIILGFAVSGLVLFSMAMIWG